MPLDIFDPRNFAEVRKPCLEASGLPGYCYTSEDWYRREIETIFMKDWLLVGRADQIPKVGDYIVEDICGETVMVVRDNHHQIRALSPICRHRGTPLVSESGSCRLFTCPYHGWTYTLEGDLIKAPQMDRAMDFDMAQHGLRAIRLESWAGFLFVNFDPNARALMDTLGSLPQIMERYKLHDMVVARNKTYMLDCNWKLYIDNTIEVMHVPYVHRGTIQKIGARDTWVMEEASVGAFLLYYGLFPGTLALMPGDEGFPPIAGFGVSNVERHDIPVLLPNCHFLATSDFFWWQSHFPEGPQRMRLEVNACFPKDRLQREDFDDVAARYYARLDRTNPEDNLASVRQHVGVRQRSYRAGRYSHWEVLVHAFANYVLDRVLDPATEK